MRLRPPKQAVPTLGDSEPEKVVAGVIALRDWYERRAAWHRRWFRMSGVAIILLSATLPLIAGLEFGAKNIVIGVIGVAIAVIAGMRNFYRWDQVWSVLRRSAFEIAFLVEHWRLEHDAIKQSGTPDQAAVNAITVRLLEAANQVRKRESTTYFGTLQFPSAGPS